MHTAKIHIVQYVSSKLIARAHICEFCPELHRRGAPLTKSCFHKHALTLLSPCRFHLLSIGSVTYLLPMLIEYCMFRLRLPLNDGIGRSDQNTWHSPQQAKDAQRLGILSFVSFPPLIS
jgi:hypothetical protein